MSPIRRLEADAEDFKKRDLQDKETNLDEAKETLPSKESKVYHPKVGRKSYRIPSFSALLERFSYPFLEVSLTSKDEFAPPFLTGASQGGGPSGV
jgi:hypothetical protein